MKSALIWLGIGLGILLIILWFYPKGLALAYQIRGGYLLDQAVQAEPAFQNDDFLCPVDPSDQVEVREMASEAENWLTKAVALNPRLSHGYLLLGRANCVLGNYENAKAWFGAFTELRPENPLGQLEFGLASLALEISNLTQNGDIPCLIDFEAGSEDDGPLVSLLAQIQKTGFDRNVLERIVNKLFFQKEYHAASCVYQLVDTIPSEENPETLFLGHLASGLSNPASAENSTVIPFVYLLEDEVLIEAPNMQWVDPLRVTGQTLAETNPVVSEFGVMWWNGSVVALVDVNKPGVVRVTTLAQNSSPEPIELQLELNLEPVAEFSLNRGDSSWEELEKDIFLKEGLNLVGIRFTNDGQVNDRDRNAYIQSIMLEKK